MLNTITDPSFDPGDHDGHVHRAVDASVDPGLHLRFELLYRTADSSKNLGRLGL
jgi:hypothetical protein